MRFPEPYGNTLDGVINWASGLVRALETFRLDVQNRYVKVNESGGIASDGRVKIGEDTSTPTNGQVRYNTATNTFQGYANGVWVNFH